MPIGSYVPGALYRASGATRSSPTARGCRHAAASRDVRERRSDRTRAGADGHAGSLRAARRQRRDRPRLHRERRRADRAPAVLSHRLWQQLFDGAPRRASARSIWIDNQPHTIVGVMPRALLVLRNELADLDAARPAGGRRPTTLSRWSSGGRRGRHARDARRAAAGRTRRSTRGRCRRDSASCAQGVGHRRHADRPAGGDRPALRARRRRCC